MLNKVGEVLIERPYSLYSINEILKYVKKNKNIVIWGLSDKTKEFIDKYKPEIEAIIDKNKELVNSFYNNIPIISFNEFLEKKDISLIVWGNHTKSILTEIENHNLISKTIFLDEDFPKIFKINSNYFNDEHKIEKKKNLFKDLVSHIEIEPHSYCNRTCWFCPNSFIDRKHNVKFMDKKILIRLLIDLKSIDYNKKISFTRYSEPFGNEVFYDSLKLVHSYLPKATLHANTNADFLTNKTVEKAYKNGLRSLFIQIYLNKDEEFDFETVDKKAQKIINRITDVKIKLKFVRDDWIEYECNYKNLNVRMYARDFKINGMNRSGIEVSSEKFSRTSPCTLVFTDVYIDFNGSIVPCCNIRSDNIEHENMMFGKLTEKENSIFEIYFSNKALSWRKSLLNFNTKKLSPCDSCNFSLIEEDIFTKNFISKIIN